MKNNLPVTKEELKAALALLEAKMVTKDEARKFATKDDLKGFATKDDLKRFATKDDLKKTEKIIRAVAHLDFEDFKQEINEKLNLLPTKDEFFTKMDELMGELQASREEQTVSVYRLSNHEDRISVLEQKVGVAVV